MTKKRKKLTEEEWIKDALKNFIEFAEALERNDDAGVYKRTLRYIHRLESDIVNLNMHLKEHEELIEELEN